MCSFIFTRTRLPILKDQINRASKFIQHRGPDYSGITQLVDKFQKSITLVHHLLDISGNTITQPLESSTDSRLFLLFNGEIFNYQSFSTEKSDTLSLLPQFKLTHENFSQSLNGEFAIVIYDHDQSTLNLFTDPFLTKPMYIGRSDNPGDFGVASYPSALTELGFNQIQMAQPNSHYKVQFFKDGLSINEKFPTNHFSINQTETTFNKWTDSFIEAVRKRATHGAHEPMVCLSSGYDSGAITLALNLLKIPYKTYTMMSGENEAVLKERLKINSSTCKEHILMPGLTKKIIRETQKEIYKYVEPFIYLHNDGLSKKLSLIDDQGSLGAYVIAKTAKANGISVSLSGSGADEIISDYGFGGNKFFYHSEFGGLFPDQLDHFFPWKKFYGDTLRSFIQKEEIILGHHGIEGRYPFLDFDTVQEFLNLSSGLKNSAYKAPICNFFEKYNYPYEPNQKRGFTVKPSPLIRRIKKNINSFFVNL
jgi:asparagine synthase (glutamine-hydrolysing)